jgi:hypothetical protein
MKKTNLIFICATLLLFTSFAFSSELNIDFDNSRTSKNSFSIKEMSSVARISTKNNKNKPLPISKMEMLNENGELTIIKASTTWIDANGNKTTYYVIPPNVQMRWVVKCPAQGYWSATKAYTFNHDEHSGHFHYDPPPPPLKFGYISESPDWPPYESYYDEPSPILFPRVEGNKTYYYWIWYPEFATRVIEQFTATGACEGTLTSHILLIAAELVELGPGTGYTLEVDTLEHFKNHYGIKQMNTALKELGSNWKTTCSTAADLSYKDMSLPWGGLFDINSDWKSPHRTHRKGINLDIDKRQVKKANRKKLIEMMCENFAVLSEWDKNREVAYYHLELLPVDQTSWGKIIEFDTDPKATHCCTASHVIPDKCISLYNDGVIIDEGIDTPSDCQ